jgi:hypothetical protein
MATNSHERKKRVLDRMNRIFRIREMRGLEG